MSEPLYTLLMSMPIMYVRTCVHVGPPDCACAKSGYRININVYIISGAHEGRRLEGALSAEYTPGSRYVLRQTIKIRYVISFPFLRFDVYTYSARTTGTHEMEGERFRDRDVALFLVRHVCHGASSRRDRELRYPSQPEELNY